MSPSRQAGASVSSIPRFVLNRETPKNDMVKEFFAQFGFVKAGGGENYAHWQLTVSEYRPARLRSSSGPRTDRRGLVLLLLGQVP